MRASLVWMALAALSRVGTAYPHMGSPITPARDTSVLSDYFNLLATKVSISKTLAAAPVCDLSLAVMPTAPTPLPPVSPGLTLKHVAVGRGTQNYTCDLTNATAVPQAIGAVATLYNASCIAATYPDILAMLPNTTLQYNLTGPNQDTLYPSNIAVSGHHYFENATLPTFNLNTPNMDLGFATCKKVNATNAPVNAPLGQGNMGNGAVAWLKLLTNAGSTGNLMEVYRVNTAGGNPPKTCTGQPASFEVQYAAEYWFYEN